MDYWIKKFIQNLMIHRNAFGPLEHSNLYSIRTFAPDIFRVLGAGMEIVPGSHSQSKPNLAAHTLGYDK